MNKLNIGVAADILAKSRFNPKFTRNAIRASLSAAAFLAGSAAVSRADPPCGKYIYVANTGEDTISKIDICSYQEVARYSTWFTKGTNFVPHRVQPNTQEGPAPSRIAVDKNGYVYVLNRFFYDAGGPTSHHRPVLVKIAPTGGTPGVDTSNGPAMIKDITDNNANNSIDPGEAQDVRILWAREIGNPGDWTTGGDEGALGRALAIDKTGVIWVGMYNSQRYYRINPTNGTPLPPLAGISVKPQTPYGCQVDMNGKLWSVNAGSSLVEIDTTTNTASLPPLSFPGTNYSLSLYNDCSSDQSKVLVYVSEWSTSKKTYVVYDPQGHYLHRRPISFQLLARPTLQILGSWSGFTRGHIFWRIWRRLLSKGTCH